MHPDSDPNNSDRSSHEYIGWIPNLAGQVFFRYTGIGRGVYDYACVNHTIKDDNGCTLKERIIISTAVIDQKDSGDRGRNGRLRVVFVAEEPKGNREKTQLSGCLYFLLIDKPKDLNNIYQDVKKLEVNTSQDSDVKIRNQYKKLIVDCQADQGAYKSNKEWPIFYESDFPVIRIKVHISSPGFVTLTFKDTVRSVSEEDEFDESGEVNASGSDRLIYCNGKEKCLSHQGKKLESPGKEEFKIIYMEQAFFYIKYFLHKHIHHSDTNDSLTTIHFHRKDKEECGSPIISDLKKALIDIKRSKLDHLKSASGIAAYGKSLALSCKKEKLINDEGANDQIQYFSNQADSIKIADERKKERHFVWRYLQRGYLSTANAMALAAVFVALMALFVSAESTRISLNGECENEVACNKLVIYQNYSVASMLRTIENKNVDGLNFFDRTASVISRAILAGHHSYVILTWLSFFFFITIASWLVYFFLIVFFDWGEPLYKNHNPPGTQIPSFLRKRANTVSRFCPSYIVVLGYLAYRDFWNRIRLGNPVILSLYVIFVLSLGISLMLFYAWLTDLAWLV